MIHLCAILALTLGLTLAVVAGPATDSTSRPFDGYVLDYNSPVDPALQAKLEAIDAKLREKHGIAADQTNVGVLDLEHNRLAMIHPDHIEYAASVPKIAILLAYFQVHPEAATKLDPDVRHELAQMIRVSSNEIASKYSHQIGLKKIQDVLNSYGFYDATHGGGIWVGKHYGAGTERYGDPVADHSHAATVRQLLRFYLLLEQGKLVSPEASKMMRKIFASPDVEPLNDRFVKGLAGRDVQVIRKSGWWEDWMHDTAVVTGPGRHYVIVALTHTPKGDGYLEDLAAAVDDVMRGQ